MADMEKALKEAESRFQAQAKYSTVGRRGTIGTVAKNKKLQVE